MGQADSTVGPAGPPSAEIDLVKVATSTDLGLMLVAANLPILNDFAFEIILVHSMNFVYLLSFNFGSSNHL
jgi:hypothetical protein